MKTISHIIKEFFSFFLLIIELPILFCVFVSAFIYPVTCVMPLVGFFFNINQKGAVSFVALLGIGFAILQGVTKVRIIPYIVNAVCWIIYIISILCSNQINNIVFFSLLFLSLFQFTTWTWYSRSDIDSITEIHPLSKNKKEKLALFNSASNNKVHFSIILLGSVFSLISLIMLIVSLINK